MKERETITMTNGVTSSTEKYLRSPVSPRPQPEDKDQGSQSHNYCQKSTKLYDLLTLFNQDVPETVPQNPIVQ
jgi:hypothetical protein